jgi:hypothetical protein
MEDNHDLTIRKENNDAISFLKNYGWVISPVGWVMYKLLLADTSTQEQCKAATELIKAGKENGAKRMKIKVDNRVGLEIKAILEDSPIQMKIINGDFMEIEVEY